MSNEFSSNTEPEHKDRWQTPDNIFLIWRPFIKPRCQFTTISRDELIGIGASILEGVKAA